MPEVNVHFTKIKEEIQRQLWKAKESIRIAVAWFTDEDLMADLIKIRKESKGKITIKVVISDAKENFLNTTNLNKLILAGIDLRIRLMNAEQRFLHQKFCVIDSHTIINGSYNWTYNAARKNEENIMVISVHPDDNLLNKFNSILNGYFQDNQSTVYSRAIIPKDANQILSVYDEHEINARKSFQKAVQSTMGEIHRINRTKPKKDKITESLIYDMIEKYGDGVNMVKRLIANAQGGAAPREGFTKLILWGRYRDLSFESIVLREEFRHLFTPEEIHTCEVLLAIH